MIFSPELVSWPLYFVAEVLQTQAGPEESGDLVLFFGRFHPFLVHLPIGFLLLAALLEWAGSFERHRELRHAVPFTLLAGFLGSLAAAVTGWLLSTAGGYGEQALSAHRLLGFAVLLLSLVAWLLRITRYGEPLFRRLFHATLVLMIVSVIAAGHYGGSLTHGSDYLFRYMPDTLRSLVGVELLEEEEEIALLEDLDTAHVYEDVIAPIIRTRCESCHNPDRTEAGLLLTSRDLLMEGGESGPPVIAYDAPESDLYRRLLLPARDEERMPPRGRRQLTNDQIRLIEWWIEQGAPADGVVSELETEGAIGAILERLTIGGQHFFDRTQVAPPDRESIARAVERGYRISPVVEGRYFLQVRLSASFRQIDSGALELLLPLADQITWLDLSRAELEDGELGVLSRFEHLTRLDLRQTAVADPAIAAIATLPELEYLNLYGTAVTDRGLEKLHGLRNLRSLYIWQTDVSEEGVRALQQSLPDLYINRGVTADSGA